MNVSALISRLEGAHTHYEDAANAAEAAAEQIEGLLSKLRDLEDLAGEVEEAINDAEISCVERYEANIEIY